VSISAAQTQSIVTGSTLDPNNPQIPAGANSQQAAFIREIWPYVVQQSIRTGIPVEVFIIQSGRETGWGTSWLFRVAHNPAGVGAFDASHGNQFPDLATGFQTYADRLMGVQEGGQGQFVADVRAHADALTLLNDIQNGPWAASHYDYTLTSNFHSLYGGGGGSSSSTGTTSGSTGQTATTTSAVGDALKTLGGWLGHVPIFGGILGQGVNGLGNAANFFGTATGFLEAVLKIFANWRYLLQFFVGFVMFMVGGFIIIMESRGPRTVINTAAAVA